MGKIILFSLLAPFFLGCGVRGDPVPPTKPPVLGRGTPTYDRAMGEVMRKQKSKEDEEEKKDPKNR